MLKLAAKISLLLCLFPSSIQAIEIAGGLGALDEGDDRYRPAAILHLGFTDKVYSRIHSYGRKHGPYKESAHIFSVNYRFPVYGNNSPITAGLGTSFLYEEIKYTPTDAADDSENLRKYNFGMSFGIGYTIPINLVYLNFSWDSHLYLAGQSGFFLSNSRKGILGMTTGIWL